jgi:hypothetical protein
MGGVTIDGLGARRPGNHTPVCMTFTGAEVHSVCETTNGFVDNVTGMFLPHQYPPSGPSDGNTGVPQDNTDLNSAKPAMKHVALHVVRWRGTSDPSRTQQSAAPE